jgi:negative regulator of genetic competence, sporulation and motility
LIANVDGFGFSLKAKERFKNIVGRKYNPDTNELTLRSDLYPDQETNEKYLVQLMMELIQESKYADEGADLGIPVKPVKLDQISTIKERMKNVETEDRKADDVFKKWKELSKSNKLPRKPIYSEMKQVVEIRYEEDK